MNYLSVGEAAKRLGVSVDVVRSLVKSGELRAIRTGGGHRRIRDDDVERRRKSQRASRNGPQVRRSPSLERRPMTRSMPRTWPVEPDPDRHFEEDLSCARPIPRGGWSRRSLTQRTFEQLTVPVRRLF